MPHQVHAKVNGIEKVAAVGPAGRAVAIGRRGRQQHGMARPGCVLRRIGFRLQNRLVDRSAKQIAHDLGMAQVSQLHQLGQRVLTAISTTTEKALPPSIVISADEVIE